MNKVIRKILILAVAVAGLWAGAITAYAAEFHLTNDNVNVRAEASTSSASVGSVNRGNSFTIEGEVTDSANNVWYRVRVSGDTFGYIRSDLGRVTGSLDGGAAGEADPIPHREATVSQSSVRVRSGPSTNHGEVASIQRGTNLVLIGETTDSSGRLWYQMTANVSGDEIIGFVRSDLITVGDLIETDDGFFDEGYDDYYDEGNDSSVADTSPSLNEQLNFEIRYVQNDVGGFDYFLYDRLQGTQWKVEEFLELISVAETNERLYGEQSDRQKTIIIILAVVIIVLALVLTVLIFKIRDLHEDAEMDLRSFRPDEGGRARGGPVKKSGSRPAEGRPSGNRPVKRSPERSYDNEDSDRGPVPNRKGQGNARPRRSEDGELRAAEREESRRDEPRRENKGPRPERKAANNAAESTAKPNMTARTAETSKRNEITDKSTRVNEKPAVKPAPARKTQNFLTDDDEFDFEFLNIDE